jgi:hypothetical protein
MTDKIEIIDHGIMQNSYFSGTSGVWINIHLDSKTTVKDIIDQLEAETNIIYDHIEYVAKYNEFTGDLESAIDMELQKIKEENKDKMDKIHAPDLEFNFDTESQDDFDMREYPVLILTIEFLEE